MASGAFENADDTNDQQNTTHNLPLLLTVARPAFTGGPRLRREPTRWDWPRRVVFSTDEGAHKYDATVRHKKHKGEHAQLGEVGCRRRN